MPKIKAPDVDSLCYVFAYLLRSEQDLPADFPIPESARDFQVGVFLPRADPDWFGRSRYPTRILLLHRDSLLLLTHPFYKAEPARLKLSDIAFYEVGHILLIGWLRFTAAASDLVLPYNTRCEPPVHEFIESVLTLCCGREANPCRERTKQHGRSLDIKFRNHLATTIRSGELLYACWFRPASERRRRWWPFHMRSEVGGNLVAYTNQRLIWIRDQWGDHYERYGSITSAAPIHSVQTLRCSWTGDVGAMTVEFHPGLSWHIPLILDARDEAEAFASSVMSALHVAVLNEENASQRRCGP